MKFFRDFYGDYEGDPFLHLRFMTTARSLLSEEEVLGILGRAFVAMHERAAALAGKRRWADKVPENVLYLTEWAQVLGEQWQLIHVVRNPLDTLASIEEARFPLTIPADLEGRLALYGRFTEAGLKFSKAHPERSYLLIYERLVSAPESVVCDLMDWLGEDFYPSQLEFNQVEHGEGLEDPKIADTREVHSSSLHRWGSVLSHEEATAIWSRTADLWLQIDSELQYVVTPQSADRGRNQGT